MSADVDRGKFIEEEDDGLPPGEALPAWAEDDGEDEEYLSPATPAPPAPPAPPPAFEDEEEAAIKRSKLLELDVPAHTVCSGCSRQISQVAIELRRTNLSTPEGAIHGTALAQTLNGRIKVIRALQDRLKSSHGTQAWLLLARAAGVLELISRDLRETAPGRHRPGAQAGKAVALTQQARAMQSLQVRLRPQQEVATFGADVI